MDVTPQLPERRSVRLKNFDYAQSGAWFITICAHEKRCIFGRIVNARVQLSDVGQIVNASWLDVPRHFPNVQLRLHVVMPNHFHALFTIHSKPRARHVAVRARCTTVPLHRETLTSEIFQRPTVGSVPTIIRSFKSAVSKRVRETLRWPTFQIWQRNYYEGRVRNERDAGDAVSYIVQNPARWHAHADNPFRSEDD